MTAPDPAMTLSEVTAFIAGHLTGVDIIAGHFVARKASTDDTYITVDIDRYPPGFAGENSTVRVLLHTTLITPTVPAEQPALPVSPTAPPIEPVAVAETPDPVIGGEPDPTVTWMPAVAVTDTAGVS